MLETMPTWFASDLSIRSCIFFGCPKFPSIFKAKNCWTLGSAGYLFFVEDDKNWNFFDALATLRHFFFLDPNGDFPTEFAQFFQCFCNLEVVAISLFSMAGSLGSLDKHHCYETKLCQGYYAASGSIWQWSGTQRCPLAWLVNRHWSVVVCCQKNQSLVFADWGHDWVTSFRSPRKAKPRNSFCLVDPVVQ